MLTAVKEPSPKEIQTQKLYQEWGLTEKEYEKVVDILGRIPNYTETGLFAVMWSEHCSYKNSKVILKKFPTTGPHVLQGPGEGAGIVDIGDDLAVVFKAESHNHPSAVEPYEGAATGVGGIIRDIFSMGARPIALLDSLRFGELDNPRTKYLLEEVVAGISGYGNCIGIPTVGGETSFDPCYEGNPLVNAMCVGLISHQDIQKGQAKGVGNTIMYVGAKTGRDGIHGATFASAEFADEKETQRSAVQVGDPFMEKLLMEACLELILDHQDVLVGIQDMGAAGLVSSSSEMASKAGSGLVLNLDKVPQRETNMTPYDIMLSESQERMLLCIQAGKEKEVQALFEKYQLDAVAIGKVTDDGQYRLYHEGHLVADIPVNALAEDAPVYLKEKKIPPRLEAFAAMPNYLPEILDATATFKQLIQQATLASKKSIYETYDSMVRTNTVIGPGSDAAVLRVRGTKKALAMTMDCNGRYLYLNPEVGGQLAVAEAARNIVASGGKPLAITDCLNYGSPEKPEVYWELWHSAKGIAKACNMLKTPVISGNVSLYNETNGQAIYPTPVIGMVGLIEKLEDITTKDYQAAGDLIYLVGETDLNFSGSELQKMLTGKIFGQLPDFDLEKEKAQQDFILSAIQKGLLASAHDCAEGGLAFALLEGSSKNHLGVKATVSLPQVAFFAETPSRFIVTVKKEKQAAFEAFAGTRAEKIGEVTKEDLFSLTGSDGEISASLSELISLNQEALLCLMK